MTLSQNSGFLRQTAIIICWILVTGGGIAVAANVVHSFWVLWSLKPITLFNYTPVILVILGVLAAAIGLAIISWIKSADRVSK